MTKRIPTNLRLLAILDVFGREDVPKTATEVGRLIGLPKQTVHRLCATLMEEGYLVREGKAGAYRPGRNARRMASSILHGSTSHLLRHQVLAKLARTIGETVNYVVPEDNGMSYKDRVETNWAFRIQLPIGTNVPFHCTASGKAFLATLPKRERQRIVNVMQLESFTAKSHTEPRAFLDELAQIARQGYALDDEEFMDGMVAAAVPVFDDTGRYMASLAFHGPVQRISRRRAIEIVPTLLESSQEITTVLFS